MTPGPGWSTPTGSTSGARAGRPHLGLGRSRADDGSAAAIAATPALAGLVSPDLSGNPARLTPAGVAGRVLPRQPGLRALDLGRCRVGPGGAAALAGSAG